MLVMLRGGFVSLLANMVGDIDWLLTFQKLLLLSPKVRLNALTFFFCNLDTNSFVSDFNRYEKNFILGLIKNISKVSKTCTT